MSIPAYKRKILRINSRLCRAKLALIKTAKHTAAIFAVTALSVLGFTACSTEAVDTHNDAMQRRVQVLEDREEIRQLLLDYGLNLDARDFDGFSKLFERDAEYVGGGQSNAIKGPEAIAHFLKDVFEKNPTGVKSPNFHLFANETIRVNGDQATALSKGIFIVPGKDNQPEAVMLATYKDAFVRENGVWKFKRRVVQGDIPSPPASE